MKNQQIEDLDTMRDEYDLDYSQAETGKYYKRLIAAGYRPVLLPPDVGKVFKDDDAVTSALRGLIEYSKKATAANSATKRRRAKAVTE